MCRKLFVCVCVWLHISLSWRPNKPWNINKETERKYKEDGGSYLCYSTDWETIPLMKTREKNFGFRLHFTGSVVTCCPIYNKWQISFWYQTVTPFTNRCSTHAQAQALCKTFCRLLVLWKCTWIWTCNIMYWYIRLSQCGRFQKEFPDVKIRYNAWQNMQPKP